SKFAYLALIRHGGDFKECAAELARSGFGSTQAEPLKNSPRPGWGAKGNKGSGADGDASFADSPLPPTEPEWPDAMRRGAYHGLAGCVRDVIGPPPESDPAALLVSFLLGFGSIVGRTAWFEVEPTCHYPNEFAVFVGRTSKARKG